MAKPINRVLLMRLLYVLICAVIIALLMVLTNYPTVIEKYYSQGLYPYVCVVWHNMLNWIPFSVGDLLYAGIVAYAVYHLFKIFYQLIKQQYKQALKKVLGLIIAVQVGVICFYLFWGLNYFRPSATVRLNLPDTAYTINDLKSTAQWLIDSANAARNRLVNTDFEIKNKEIYQVAIDAITVLSNRSDNFQTYKPHIKSSLLTPIINYLGTSGYYNPFTAEANINYQMPIVARPFVACHELAHQMGLGSEDEASFAGFLAGIGSENKLLRYSVYYETMAEFMYTIQSVDSVAYKELKQEILPNVLSDWRNERAYWQRYSGQLEKISSIFYNSFLQANNQPYGLLTYNRMVALVMAWHKQEYTEN